MDSELSKTAYHEAGHVLLAEWCGGHVVFASVIPADYESIRSHGETRAVWTAAGDAKEHALQLARVALAGPVAEMIYSDEQYEPRLLSEWRCDWLAARSAIRDVLPHQNNDQEVDVLLSKLFKQLIDLFARDEVWDRIAMVADQLEAFESLEQDQLQEMREEGYFQNPLRY